MHSNDRQRLQRNIPYGTDAHQVGDLYLPGAPSPAPAVLCLLHGGFWRMPHGRAQMDAIAQDLCARGYAVWNLGYRRVGAPGGGWPGTFEDIAAGLDHLATLVAQGVAIDLQRIAVVGHSAGGQLALCSGARDAQRGNCARPTRVQIAAVAALAPVADLVQAHDLDAGAGAVAELLGGDPQQFRERCQDTSPIAMLPLRVRQLVMHGGADAALPVQMSRDYVRRATAAGDAVDYIELEGAGHMAFLDPCSEAHRQLTRWLAAAL